ncbi:MAG: diadenylate cyclase [Deltaproteobacteria bacterium]|nr:diadenylate cyclase [Deltaproteobacteria bacterium]
MPRKATSAQLEIIRAALALASKRPFAHLLYVGDLPLPEEPFRGRSQVRKKLVQAIVSPAQRQVVEAMGIPVLPLPKYDLGRSEKLKIAIVTGIARGLYSEGESVVALLSRKPASLPDSILVVTVGGEGEEGGFSFLHDESIPPEVLEAVIDLAVTTGVEGWEGRPLGALFVIGDSNSAMENSRQMSLNPFRGYSEDERNLLNPDVQRSLRAFAVLDGAFVIREDGVVLAAGRYLNFDEQNVQVPLGLGARHMAAAGISTQTEAIAVAVSQTSGVVRVFKKGRAVLELAPRTRRG